MENDETMEVLEARRYAAETELVAIGRRVSVELHELESDIQQLYTRVHRLVCDHPSLPSYDRAVRVLEELHLSVRSLDLTAMREDAERAQEIRKGLAECDRRVGELFGITVEELERELTH